MVVKLFYQIFFTNVFGFDKLNVKFYISNRKLSERFNCRAQRKISFCLRFT